MIVITLGSQKFQFNRLLAAVDRLIAEGKITEEVFAQTGSSTYVPKHFKSEAFLNRPQFNEMVERADLVITHGGAGSIVTALKLGKRVIAVPRRRAYHEHVDDHQLDIIRRFVDEGKIVGCEDPEDLFTAIEKAKSMVQTEKVIFGGGRIEADIRNYLQDVFPEHDR